MSVREQEEERRKKTCSSSGLGLAAAAIGMGVGAALYYFLNKRPEENRESGASSSEDWSYEQQQTFNPHNESYSSTSEYTTTDTSVNDSIGEESYTDESETGIDTSEDADDESETGMDTSEEDTADEISDSMYVSDSEVSFTYNGDSSYERRLNSDWDVTDSSQGVPEVYPPSTLNTICHHVVQVFSPNVRKQQRNTPSKKFRERSWSLEECSICFDVMLQDQDLLVLPCTHRFHVGCIGPWLEAQQTCPNCRKSAE